jgi:hypothetical protein
VIDDDFDRALCCDWDFHQATGMIAAQLGMFNMAGAAQRLISLAVELDESVHDTALLVLDRRVRFSRDTR